MTVVCITLHWWRETARALPGSLPNREHRRGRSPMAARLLTAAFVCAEVTAGGQPRQRVPQLAGVLPSRNRGDDRAKEAVLTIDRGGIQGHGWRHLSPLVVCNDAVTRARLAHGTALLSARRVSVRYSPAVEMLRMKDLDTVRE